MDGDESTGWPHDGYGDEDPSTLEPSDSESLPSGYVTYDDSVDDVPTAGDPEGPDGLTDVDGPASSGVGFEVEPDVESPLGEAGVDVTFDPSPEVSDERPDSPTTEADLAGTGETPGVDPDADPLADDESWESDPFPPPLDLHPPPEPVDGMPWSDPTTLGDAEHEPVAAATAGSEGSPPVSDLYAYDGADAGVGDAVGDADSWGSLERSDDPATSSLARFWSPRD